MVVAGDITEVAVNHPDFGVVRFYPKANETNTFNTGGVRNDDDENGVDGSGELIVAKRRIRGGLEVVIANDMNVREDHTKAVQIAESPVNATYTVSLINGTQWRGRGVIVGDLSPDTNTGLFTLKVACTRFSKL